MSALGIGYALSNSLSDSIISFFENNTNVSENASKIISSQLIQKASNILTIQQIAFVLVVGVFILIFVSAVNMRRKKKMEKLFFDILKNKINGETEEVRCIEISNRYYAIVLKKKIGGIENMSKINLYVIGVGIVLAVFFGIIYYITKEPQLIFSGLVAFATLVYAYLTFLLVSLTKDMRDYQKEQREPNVKIDFQPEEDDMNFVHMVIENTGKNTAYSAKINITPDFEYYAGKKLSELPLITDTHDIPANKRISFYLTNMLQNTEEKTQEPYKISVDYKNERGETFHKELEIDLKMLSGTLYSAFNPMKDIRNSLDEINKNIRAVTNGTKKMKTVTYTKEEYETDKKEELERAKKMIEEQKKLWSLDC